MAPKSYRLDVQSRTRRFCFWLIFTLASLLPLSNGQRLQQLLTIRPTSITPFPDDLHRLFGVDTLPDRGVPCFECALGGEPSTIFAPLPIPSLAGGVDSVLGLTIEFPDEPRERLKHGFMVSIVNGQGRVACGGALIGPQDGFTAQHVLTAASCVDVATGGVLNPTVVVNSISGTTKSKGSKAISVSNIGMHPDWKASGSNGRTSPNLAILELSEPVFVVPVKLPETASFTLMAETELVVLGYGRLAASSAHAEKIQEVGMQVTDEAICPLLVGRPVAQHEFCMHATTATCSGDSGGPIIQVGKSNLDAVIVGVVGDVTPCGEDGQVEVHTLVAPHIEWMKSAAGLD